MIVIGITGGIASGKSIVTSLLKSFGAVVLDADRIGHEVLLRDPVKKAIRELWGDDPFDSLGNIDRQRLANIVFDPSAPEQLSRLERISHPLIEAEMQLEIQRFRQADDLPALIMDAPIMVKTGWYKLCDEIIFVDASQQLRWQRAKRRGWTEEMFQSREAMQASIQQKKEISSFVIDNNGSLESTGQQVQEIWQKLLERTR